MTYSLPCQYLTHESRTLHFNDFYNLIILSAEVTGSFFPPKPSQSPYNLATERGVLVLHSHSYLGEMVAKYKNYTISY